MKAQDGRSSDDSPTGCASAVLAAACDSPVSTDSSHSRSCTSISRRSAGHHVADAQMHEVAGNDLADADLRRLPVAIDEGEMADLRVQRLDRLLRAVLVEKARARRSSA